MESVSSWFASSSKAAKDGVSAFWERNETQINETKENMKKVAGDMGKAAANAKEEMAKNLEGVGKAATNMFSFISSVVTNSHSPEDLGISYINDRLLAMGYPSPKESHLGCPLRNISAYLNEKHKDKYMVFNLSEKIYDASKFNGQVMEFKFPGYPSPPLGTLLSIMKSMHSWLCASKDNIVVVHCYTGKGRTALILAAYLIWTGDFSTPKNAIAHIAEKRRIAISDLVIPSQLRYLNYFYKALKGYKLSRKPLRFSTLCANSSRTDVSAESLTIEVFENGQLVNRSTMKGTGADGKSSDEKEAGKGTDSMPIYFESNVNVEGDILVRIQREIKDEGETRKGSIFRLAFHTGFESVGEKIFAKRDVDLASTSTAFDPDFKVTVNFEKAVTNYGKPLKGKLAPKYWDAIQKVADGPPKIVIPSEEEEGKAKAPLSPLDASGPQPEEKTNETKADKSIESKTEKAKDEENPTTTTVKVSNESKSKLDELMNDLDVDDDEDEDDEATEALLQQIKDDGDDGDDDDLDEDMSFELIKNTDASSPPQSSTE